MADPCKGCFYRRGSTEASKSCDYILIEGHRRPCPPGKGCTVKKKERRRKKKAPDA